MSTVISKIFKVERDPFFRMGEKQGLEQGLEQAETRAEQERVKAEQRAYAEKLAAAAKMKKSGLDNVMIADVLSLPLEVVEKL